MTKNEANRLVFYLLRKLYLQCKLYFDFCQSYILADAKVKVNPQLAQRANITP